MKIEDKFILFSKLTAMEEDSFEGWSKEAKKGYLTAVKTLKEFIKKQNTRTEVSTPTIVK